MKLPRPLMDLLTILEKEAKAYLRWKEWILIDIVGMMINVLIFILVWGGIFMATGIVGIGKITAKNFVPFLVTGQILATVMNTSLSGNVTQTFISEKYRSQTLSYLLISPLSLFTLPFGKIAIPLLRMIVQNSAIIALAVLVFGFPIHGSPILALLIVAITFLGFYGLGLIFASLGVWRDGIAYASTLVAIILVALSATYYPIKILEVVPGLKEFSLALPSTQAVLTAREVLLFGSGIGEIWPAFIYLICFAATALTLAFLAFKLAQRKALLVA